MQAFARGGITALPANFVSLVLVDRELRTPDLLANCIFFPSQPHQICRAWGDADGAVHALDTCM